MTDNLDPLTTLRDLQNEYDNKRACKDLKKEPSNLTDYCLNCYFGVFDEHSEEWVCMYIPPLL